MATFASLFTGGGLADIGAMNAGYELLWGIELDSDIAAIANANLPHRDTVYTASVIGFDWSSVQRPDHLHMSPPCQDFSVAKTTGKKANPNDDIADACIQAIKALTPSSITLENVEGYRKAKGFQKIVDTLWGLGYWVNVDVLNAADFGVPQTRRRLILRAVLGGFPAPLPPKETWRGWYDAIADLVDTLPETQFAEWQLKRLPDELKTIVDGSFQVPNPEPLNLADLTGLDGEEFERTVSDWCDKNRFHAYLVESKNSNQQYGDGIRDFWEPHTTVVTDHKPSHQPKAFIVDGKTNGNGDRGNAITVDDPMFCVNASAAKQGIRAHLVPGGNSSSFSTRAGTEPSRTVESTERVGNMPRALLLNSAFPESNGKKHYTDDEVSFTVDTTSLGRMKASAQGRVVRMTPRALARFQTVPDWYELPEKKALACKIIGNGVPCLMMQKILGNLQLNTTSNTSAPDTLTSLTSSE